MDPCLIDIINDPQALKDFLRSNSQTDAAHSDNDVGLSATSLDEALSSSFDYLASITTSATSSTGDYGIISIAGVQQPTIDNSQALYNQMPMGLDFDVFTSGLNNSLNTTSGNTLQQTNALPTATFDTTFQPTVPQPQSGNTLYNSGQGVSISRPGSKQAVPLILGSTNSPTPQQAAAMKTSTPLKSAQVMAPNAQARVPNAQVMASNAQVMLPSAQARKAVIGTSKALPINLDQVAQQPETKLTNVFPGGQQTIINNGMTSTNGQAILVPSGGGKMFIVNSPAKGNQTIALAAAGDFLQQQNSYLTGAAPNTTLPTKQLFVLPSQIPNADLTKQAQILGIAPQGLTTVNNSSPVQQLNINYPNSGQTKNMKLPNMVTKSEGQPTGSQSTAMNASQPDLQPRPQGLQNVNLLVPSQRRGILPKRPTQPASAAQHQNILPKVTISQSVVPGKSFGNTKTNSVKNMVPLYPTNSVQATNQQLPTQQISVGGIHFITSQVNRTQAFPTNAQSTVGPSSLSILPAAVRNTPGQSPSPKPGNSSPAPSTIGHVATPTQSGNQLVANDVYNTTLNNQNVGVMNTAKSLSGTGQVDTSRPTPSPVKRVQAPRTNQSGVNQSGIVFKSTQNVVGSQVGVPSITNTQMKALDAYQSTTVLQQAVLNATSAVVASPSIPQTSIMTGQRIQPTQITQLTTGVAPQVQTRPQAPNQPQPQYSLLGKEGIQKLMQLCQQQGQAPGQKLTSLGSLGAAKITALMQKLMYSQQQQQQQPPGTQVQLQQGNSVVPQQLIQTASSQVPVLTQPTVAAAGQIASQPMAIPQSGAITNALSQGQVTAGNQTVKLTHLPTSVQMMPSGDLTSLSNLLVTANKDVATAPKSSIDTSRQSLPIKTQGSATVSSPVKQQAIGQNIQIVRTTPVGKQGENKPLLVQLPQEKGSSSTSFISTAQLTQSQLQDLQQKLLAQKINQQAQHLLPKQLISSVAQTSQAVSVASTSKTGQSGVKANVLYVKPTARQQKPAANVSLQGTINALPNLVTTTTVLTSQTNQQPSKIVIKPLFSTPSASVESRPTATKVVPAPAARQKAAVKVPSSVGEIQTSPQGHQKIIVSKKIKDQLQDLSQAQKEQLLRNPNQMLVINGQKVPLAKLLQQLAEEAKVTVKTSKTTGKRPLATKETEEKPVEEPESKVTKRLKHCLAADQARVLKPERDKCFRSAEDALSKLIPYHVYYEATPEKSVFQKDERTFDGVAQQLIDKKDDLIRRFDVLLLREYQRSVSTAELVMLSRLFVTDEKALLQRDKQDAQEGKFQLNLFNEEEDSEDSEEEEVPSPSNLLCGEEMDDEEVASDVEEIEDELNLPEIDDVAMEESEHIQVDQGLELSVSDSPVDEDMTQELNEATSNLLADLESDDMFSL